jgi:hypothetical protein
MIIPGQGVRVVRMYLAALCADKPALHAMIGLKIGSCHRGCHLCCFDLKRNMDPYDPNVHKFRDYELLLKMQRFCAEYCVRLEAGADVSALKERYSAASKFCEYYGALGAVTAFANGPLGYNSPSDVFKIAVRDIFHDLEAGLFPAILMMVLRIVQAISHNDTRYSDALSLLDACTSSKRMLRIVPRYEGMDHTSFHEGCGTMLLKTATGQANSGATGTTAGMRSSWSKVMMTAILVAIGTSNGDILPVQDNYILKRTVKVTTTESVTVQDSTTNIGKKRKVTTSATEARDNNACIGNPSRLCTLVLAIALDVYAEFNRSFWTPELVAQVEKKVRELQACFSVLHQVMISCCRVPSHEDDYQVPSLVPYLFNFIPSN